MAWIVAGLLASLAVAETPDGMTVELKYGGTASVVRQPYPDRGEWLVDGTWLRAGDRYRSEREDTYMIDWPSEGAHVPDFVAVRDLLTLPLSESGEFAPPAAHEIERRFRLSIYGGHGSRRITDSESLPERAGLRRPDAVAVDAEDNVFVTVHGRIRWIEAETGIIRTLAGTGEHGFGGDGGPATEAKLSYPRDVAVDADGNVYFVDTNSNRLRFVDVDTGVIETVASTGIGWFNGDAGPAETTQFDGPVSVAIDTAGSLYVLDQGNCRLRKIDRGTSRTETLAAHPALCLAHDVAVDRTGRLFIASDGTNIPGRPVGLWTGAEIPVLKVSAGLSGEPVEFTIEEDGVLRLDGKLVLKGGRVILGGREIELAEGIRGSASELESGNSLTKLIDQRQWGNYRIALRTGLPFPNTSILLSRLDPCVSSHSGSDRQEEYPGMN